MSFAYDFLPQNAIDPKDFPLYDKHSAFTQIYDKAKFNLII